MHTRSGPFALALALVTALIVLPTTTASARPSSHAYMVTSFAPPTMVSGTTLAIHGRVTPVTSKHYLRVETREAGSTVWSLRRWAFIHRDGSYATQVLLMEPGLGAARIVKPASLGYARGISRTETVQVSPPPSS